MKNKILIIGIILSVSMMILLFLLWKSYKSTYDRLQVALENQENLLNEKQSYVLKLTGEQQRSSYLEKNLQRQSAALDSLRTKWRNVDQISTVYIHTVDTVNDTIVIPQFVNIGGELEFQSWTITDGCFDISGLAQSDVILTDKAYTDTLFIALVSGERRNLFGIKWLPEWGRKKPDTVRNWSNCGEVQTVVIDKRKE